MSRRKAFTYLLGVSFIAGIARETLRKKNQKSTSVEDSLITGFVGIWSFADSLSSQNKTLIIDDQSRLFINKKPVNGSVAHLDEQKLVFIDHYGYKLVFRLVNNETLTLFDSADDKKYTLTLLSDNPPSFS
ncbi:DUF4828 domain-containing protein [Desemzia incerta]|uniref:DUF4828 domain-containing protein n=1 Tax=Desemzia incerta TaxID=82801 RepID=UPI0024C2E4AA|nr:DUF4828 domain-containing protein [Desemzia incerta]WHZ32122.1 DUF4828 domain-containing protein [Desemzia incerta]